MTRSDDRGADDQRSWMTAEPMTQHVVMTTSWMTPSVMTVPDDTA